LFIKCLAVGIGGFLGSVLRYLLSEIPIKQINYPVNTLITNFRNFNFSVKDNLFELFYFI